MVFQHKETKRTVLGVELRRLTGRRYSAWACSSFLIERASFGPARWKLPTRWRAVVAGVRGKCRFTMREAVQEALAILSAQAGQDGSAKQLAKLPETETP